MSTGRSNQIWLAAGALGAVAMLAIGWFLLIGPQRSETAALEERIAGEQDNVTSLQKKLVSLNEQNNNKEQYKAELEENRKALPATPAMTDFVRQVNAGAAATGVAVTSISISEPGKIADAKAPLYALQVTLTATGNDTKLDRFLDQLQQVQPRAVLIGSTSVSAVENEANPTVNRSMTINLAAFVSPESSGIKETPSPAAGQ